MSFFAGSRKVALLGVMFSIAAFAADAKKNLIADEASVVLTGDNDRQCLGYTLEVPNGADEAVVTLASCLGDFRTGKLNIPQTNGSNLASKSVLLPEALKKLTPETVPADADLAVVTFASGSLKDGAAAPTLAKAKKDSARLYAGAPLLSEDKTLLGLVRDCAIDSKTFSCRSVLFNTKEIKTFLAGVQETIWGKQEVAVAGTDHQYFGRRGCLFGRRGGGGGYSYYPVYYQPVYYQPVQYTRIVVIQQVQVNYNVTVYNNSFNNNVNSFNRGHGNNYNSGGSGGYSGGYTGGSYGAPSCPQPAEQEEVAKAPEPKPAYIGIYDPGAIRPDTAVASLSGSVAKTSGDLTADRGGESIAKALPNTAVNSSHVASMTKELREKDAVAVATTPNAQWNVAAANRTDRAALLAKANGERRDLVVLAITTTATVADKK